jgi:hypothetical protein
MNTLPYAVYFVAHHQKRDPALARQAVAEVLPDDTKDIECTINDIEMAVTKSALESPPTQAYFEVDAEHRSGGRFVENVSCLFPRKLNLDCQGHLRMMFIQASVAWAMIDDGDFYLPYITYHNRVPFDNNTAESALAALNNASYLVGDVASIIPESDALRIKTDAHLFMVDNGVPALFSVSAPTKAEAEDKIRTSHSNASILHLGTTNDALKNTTVL